jgi:uncharacterized protein
MNHLANWIEIPAADLARAAKFYREILQAELNEMQIGETRYAIFRTDDRFNCGTLACSAMHKPSQDGVVVYLDGGDDLSAVLARVKKAGAKVLAEKTFIAKEAGYYALFIDTEGNRIGLHSMA